MNDKIFFGALTYLFIVVVVSGFIPADVYTGARFGTGQLSELEQNANTTISEVQTETSQYNFILSVLTFMFITVTITGIPLAISFIINFLNILCVIITVVYVYDKIRGIGS